jgi:murein DD-endopeptidase MepM/ murein hydrolase activator NlpD
MRGALLLIIIFLIFTPIFYLFTKNSYKKLEIYNKGTLVDIKGKAPKVNEKRVFEINLSENRIDFYENGRLRESFKIAYQSKEGVWYQTPTGYFRIGIKKEKHLSSIFPVYMDNAVQFYEDFFIHGIPYYENGQKVSSQFSGGCLRLEDDDAKRFYNLAKKNDLVIVFLTLDNFKVNPKFSFPVNKNEYWIRQRFNSPLRTRYTRSENRKIDYIQHAGVDLAPNPDAKDFNVYSIYDGKIVKIVKNGNEDHGLGNVIIIEHNIDTLQNTTQTNPVTDIRVNQRLNPRSSAVYSNNISVNQRSDPRSSAVYSNNIRVNPRSDQRLSAVYSDNIRVNPRSDPRSSAVYSLYAHLEKIREDLKEGDYVKKGEKIGEVGATGYGCNYWRIGEDGCDKLSRLDKHLHFEIKILPTLESPIEAKCFVNGSYKPCYGYVPDNPEKYGYLNPLKFLSEE